MRSTKIITTTGFALGLIAIAMAIFGVSRAFVIQWFAIGFVIAAFGITLNLLFLPPERFNGISPFGFRVAAVGFGITSIPTVVGGFLLGKTDNELEIFFWSGAALTVIGLLIHGWSVYVGKRG